MRGARPGARAGNASRPPRLARPVTVTARVRRTRCGLRSVALAVAFVDEAQALEGEPRLEVLDRARVRHDQLRETAGGDHGARPELGLEAIDEAVDLPAVPVDRARLDRLDRRLADDVLRRDQLDSAQHRGAFEQRVERDLDARE